MICDLTPFIDARSGFIPSQRRAVMAEQRSRLRVLEKSLRFHPANKRRIAAHERAIAQLKIDMVAV